MLLSVAMLVFENPALEQCMSVGYGPLCLHRCQSQRCFQKVAHALGPCPELSGETPIAWGAASSCMKTLGCSFECGGDFSSSFFPVEQWSGILPGVSYEE